MEPLATIDELDGTDDDETNVGVGLDNPNDPDFQPTPVTGEANADEEEEAEEEDPYLVESGRILLDMIGLQANGVSLAVGRQAN
jgi:hypothetical protein